MTRPNDAGQKVEGMDSEDALKTLSAQPVGYFQEQDFNMQIPNDPDYQKMEGSLQVFFKHNSFPIQYLRQNTGDDIDLEAIRK